MVYDFTKSNKTIEILLSISKYSVVLLLFSQIIGHCCVCEIRNDQEIKFDFDNGLPFTILIINLWRILPMASVSEMDR